ncbi:hypothetical protein IC614_08775 [Allosphingosinicella flava]|uniref:Uncharacterized protein n=1 Tax=Allosphingosinicella flava TaxID=2771430 RepID=A0A7T2GIN6_9SPHN|nr:hypothetical protein [Sphingosinicella flava]QPQ54437.1 hypothetical protein IC614_08775 [Sphingosinicella flava]
MHNLKNDLVWLVAVLAAAQPAAGFANGKNVDLSAYREMSPEQTLPFIAKALRDNLLDAGSVTNFSACYPPVKVKFKDGRPVRWTIMLSLNAKNSYGGYTGLEQMAAVFYADKPVMLGSTGMSPSSKLLGSCTRVSDAEIQRMIQE